MAKRYIMPSAQQVCVFFFRGRNCDTVLHFFSMVSFFTCTRPNRSSVGAIDKPDHPEQPFDQYDTPEDPEKFSRTTFR